jgi:hypothetical protein
MIESAKIFVPALITLVAGYLGLRYGLAQLREQRRLDFVSRQLNEFYSPILGYREAIRAKSELRLKISQAANAAWQEVSANRSSSSNLDEDFEPYRRIIQYNNTQLRDELIPIYRQMLTVFRDKYWLAEVETRKWFGELSDFVEIWERWLSDNLPGPVVDRLQHDEARLKPFYEELVRTLDRLRGELAAPRSRWAAVRSRRGSGAEP